jgi:hypothetical protein
MGEVPETLVTVPPVAVVTHVVPFQNSRLLMVLL